jgi:hypothetical protein
MCDGGSNILTGGFFNLIIGLPSFPFLGLGKDSFLIPYLFQASFLSTFCKRGYLISVLL